jgi:8-oxo-dGTP diphosphatase
MPWTTVSSGHPQALWTKGHHGQGYLDNNGRVVSWPCEQQPLNNLEPGRDTPNDVYATFRLSPGGHATPNLHGPMRINEFYRLLQHAHPEAAPHWTRGNETVDQRWSHKPSKPPKYFVQKNPGTEKCGTCTMFTDGKCWGYANTPVSKNGICESYNRDGRKKAALDPDLQMSAWTLQQATEPMTRQEAVQRLMMIHPGTTEQQADMAMQNALMMWFEGGDDGGAYQGPHWQRVIQEDINDNVNPNPDIPRRQGGMTLPQEQRRWEQLGMLYPNAQVHHTFPDGSTIKRHGEAGSINRVGEFMRNCWRNTHPDLLQGNTQAGWSYHSLHDPHDLPRAAFYLEDNPHTIEAPRVVQALGMRNQAVDVEHANALRQWADAKGYRHTNSPGSIESAEDFYNRTFNTQPVTVPGTNIQVQAPIQMQMGEPRHASDSYFHVTSPDNRQAIQTNGLVPGKGNEVWLHNNYDKASLYSANSGDIWKVDASGLPLNHGRGNWNAQTYNGTIPSQRLQLVRPHPEQGRSLADIWQNKVASPVDDSYWEEHTTNPDEELSQHWTPETEYPRWTNLYHGTTYNRAKDIMQQGLKPWDHPDVNRHNWSSGWEGQGMRSWLEPRPGHTYMTSNKDFAWRLGDLTSNRNPRDPGRVIEVDPRWLNAQNINPDEDSINEDTMPGSRQDYPSKGQMAQSIGWGDDPEQSHGVLNNAQTVAHNGVVPPHAIKGMHTYHGTDDDPGGWKFERNPLYRDPTHDREFVGAAGDSFGWTNCDQGHEHWGPHGAAGLLVHHIGEDGQTRYLMQQRSPSVQHGGTWSIPGGAMDSHETPQQAALREAQEEGMSHSLTPLHTTVDDHGNWAYHTVHAQSPQQFQLAPNFETSASGWFTPQEMQSLNLHPGFAATMNQNIRSSHLDTKHAISPRQLDGDLDDDSAVSELDAWLKGIRNSTQPDTPPNVNVTPSGESTGLPSQDAVDGPGALASFRPVVEPALGLRDLRRRENRLDRDAAEIGPQMGNATRPVAMRAGRVQNIVVGGDDAILPVEGGNRGAHALASGALLPDRLIERGMIGMPVGQERQGEGADRHQQRPEHDHIEHLARHQHDQAKSAEQHQHPQHDAELPFGIALAQQPQTRADPAHAKAAVEDRRGHLPARLLKALRKPFARIGYEQPEVAEQRPRPVDRIENRHGETLASPKAEHDDFIDDLGPAPRDEWHGAHNAAFADQPDGTPDEVEPAARAFGHELEPVGNPAEHRQSYRCRNCQQHAGYWKGKLMGKAVIEPCVGGRTPQGEGYEAPRDITQQFDIPQTNFQFYPGAQPHQGSVPEPYCPHCHEEMFFHPKNNPAFGSWACAQNPQHTFDGPANADQALINRATPDSLTGTNMSLEHPDPWMDNEPGATQFPAHWASLPEGWQDKWPDHPPVPQSPELATHDDNQLGLHFCPQCGDEINWHQSFEMGTTTRRCDTCGYSDAISNPGGKADPLEQAYKQSSDDLPEGWWDKPEACPHCGATDEYQGGLCYSCGHGSMPCPKCGEETGANQGHCISCGYQIYGEGNPPEAKPEWTMEPEQVTERIKGRPPIQGSAQERKSNGDTHGPTRSLRGTPMHLLRPGHRAGHSSLSDMRAQDGMVPSVSARLTDTAHQRDGVVGGTDPFGQPTPEPTLAWEPGEYGRGLYNQRTKQLAHWPEQWSEHDGMRSSLGWMDQPVIPMFIDPQGHWTLAEDGWGDYYDEAHQQIGRLDPRLKSLDERSRNAKALPLYAPMDDLLPSPFTTQANASSPSIEYRAPSRASSSPQGLAHLRPTYGQAIRAVDEAMARLGE